LLTSKKNQTNLLYYLAKRMQSLTRFSVIGIPATIGIGIAWVGNRIIKNEKGLKDRELELKLQLNNKFH